MRTEAGATPSNSLVHELFEAQVVRSPDLTAVRSGEETVTYAELEARANRIAGALRWRGACRGQRVGLSLERGVDMIAAVLGVLKTGAAYVPLDPAFPDERLDYMVRDADLRILVSTGTPANDFGIPHECQLRLDSDLSVLESQSAERLPPDAMLSAGPGDPAYVIYTSGSTGRPKGVVVPHRAVVNFLTSMAREPGLNSEDVLVAVTTLSFDIAVLELLLPIIRGAIVVIASRGEAIDGNALSALLEQHQATVMQATPVTWRLLLEAGWQGFEGFKALVGGEALPTDLANQLITLGIELWNMYGPTETTVWSTCARIVNTSNGITIGKPIANTVVYVLDEQNNKCSLGEAGELCIGGEGLALGYWNRPDLSAERFIEDPFSSVPGASLYRTGDLARWRDDGTLEHLGRLDFQVKVRGFRIELGEIEAVMAIHPNVREAVVVVREDTPGDQRLAAYVVVRDDELTPADLKRHLSDQLPPYMIPSAYVMLDALPLTPNAKIDRRALPEPGQSDVLQAVYVAPQTETEEMLIGIWRELLGLEHIGTNDNFFELGGHSLLVSHLVASIAMTFSIELPMREFYTAPTVAMLGLHVESLRGGVDAGLIMTRKPNKLRIERMNASKARAALGWD